MFLVFFLVLMFLIYYTILLPRKVCVCVCFFFEFVWLIQEEEGCVDVIALEHVINLSIIG